MKFIGLDVGNGSIGMCIKPAYGAAKTSIYPSTYAVYDPGVIDLSMSPKSKTRVDVFQMDDCDYVIGAHVLKARGTAILAFDREDRYRRPEFQKLTKLALLDAATKDGSTGFIEVELGVGTPAEDYTSSTVDELKKWFDTPIVGYKNGEDVTVVVKQLEVASQPIAVLMDNYLDSYGFVHDESFEDAKVLVIDCGSGTLDMSEFNGMKLLKQGSEGIGMTDVYACVLERIHQENSKIRIDLVNLEAQLRTQDGSHERVINYGQTRTDVTKAYHDAMNATWQRILGAIVQRFPDRLGFDKIILAGGTGEAFADRFKEWNPMIVIPNQPALSIARGLCKQVLSNTDHAVTP